MNPGAVEIQESAFTDLQGDGMDGMKAEVVVRIDTKVKALLLNRIKMG